MSRLFIAAVIFCGIYSSEAFAEGAAKTKPAIAAESAPVDKMSPEQLQAMEKDLVSQMSKAGEVKPSEDKSAQKAAAAPAEPATKKSPPAPAKAALAAKADSKKELDEANAKLKNAQSKIDALNQELEESRNRLLIAETEVDRLSRIIETKKQSDLNLNRGAAQRDTTRVQSSAKTQDDTQIATVVADKAFLRSGPGKNNSPLMSVSQGTRLAVEIQQGGWYRVISPTGARAWVDGEVVAFGANPSEGPTQTVKVRGFESAVDEAFDVIKQGSK